MPKRHPASRLRSHVSVLPWMKCTGRASSHMVEQNIHWKNRPGNTRHAIRGGMEEQ